MRLKIYYTQRKKNIRVSINTQEFWNMIKQETKSKNPGSSRVGAEIIAKGTEN